MTYENEEKTKRIYKEALTEYMSRGLWFALCGAVGFALIGLIIIGLNTVGLVSSSTPVVYPKDALNSAVMLGAVFGFLIGTMTRN